MSVMLAWTLAAAIAPTEGVFRLGETVLTADLPNGYCLPAADDPGVARLLVEHGPDASISLLVQNCANERRWIDYFLIGTPKGMPSITTNAELQRLMEPVLAIGANMDEFLRRTSQMGRGSGTKIDFEGTNVYFSKDDMCLYMGGNQEVKAEGDGRAYTRTEAGCMTVVEGKVVAIFRYGEGGTIADIEALFPSLGTFAKGIRKASAQ